MNKKKALIISQDNIDKIKNVLLLFGFSVDVKTEFDKTGKLINDNEYNIIFTDAKLPNMIYFEHIKAIKSNTNYNSVPIFVLSYDGIVETKQVISAGCNDLILHPFTNDKILNALKNIKWSNKD